MARLGWHAITCHLASNAIKAYTYGNGVLYGRTSAFCTQRQGA
jgi:hypothetical protein